MKSFFSNARPEWLSPSRRPASQQTSGGKENSKNYSRCMPASISVPSPWKSSKKSASRAVRNAGGRDDDLVTVSAHVVCLDADEQRNSLVRGHSVHENGVTTIKDLEKTPRNRLRILENEPDRNLYQSQEDLFKYSRFTSPVAAAASLKQQTPVANGHAAHVHTSSNGAFYGHDATAPSKRPGMSHRSLLVLR